MKRQGDVSLIPTTDTSELVPMPLDPRGVVLADGSTSGHFHGVFGGEAKLSRFKDGRADQLLELAGDAEVRVVGGGSGDGAPRHTPITLSAGRYLVRVQRSWDSSRAQRVED